MTHPFRRRTLADILVDRGAVRAGDLPADLADRDTQLAEALLNAQRINPEQLAQALAEQFRLPYVDLREHAITPELFALIPADQAYEFGALPYQRSGDILEVAVSDPADLDLIDALERRTGLSVRLLVGSARAISEALKRSEGGAEVLRGVSEGFKIVMVVENDQGQDEYVSLEAGDREAGPVVRLINSILMAAIQKRASDVHIETYEKGIVVKYRIDGVLYPATDVLDRRHHGALIARLKVMAELDIAEKRVPQDGRFRLRINNRDIDFRVSILPSVFGEDVVIRILDKSSVTDGVRALRLEVLGVQGEVLKRLRRNVHEPYGMILITGPTGSGKTTTLYAALSELNHGEEKIITVEDPVEYQLDGVVQIAVNEKKGLTFAKGLRSILRHDPDKIMVGEIRDAETAQIAVQAALTGHLVFTTVHANNAIDVMGRFAHMGVDPYHFVSALNCVMAQRLVRLICPQCKQPADPDPDVLEISALDPQLLKGVQLYEGRGCDHCGGTGYRGRGAITELLELSPRMRELIVERRPGKELEAVAIEEGMFTLRQSAVAKMLAGDTTLREINRVTFIDG